MLHSPSPLRWQRPFFLPPHSPHLTQHSNYSTRYSICTANGEELPVVVWLTAEEEQDAEGLIQAVVVVAVDQAAAGG